MAPKSGTPHLLTILSGDDASKKTMANPNLGVSLTRVVAVVSLIFFVVQLLFTPTWERWARIDVLGPQAEGAPQVSPYERTGARLVLQIAQPHIQRGMQLATAGVLSVMLLELTHHLLLRVTLAFAPVRSTTTYVRVRTLSANNRVKFPKTDVAEHMRSIIAGMRSIRGARVALVLSRTPNQPAQLGVQIRMTTPAQAASPQAKPATAQRRRRRRNWWPQITLRRRHAPAASADGPAAPWVRPARLARPGRQALAPVATSVGTTLTPADRRFSEALRILTSVIKRFDETALLDRVPDPLEQAVRADGAHMISTEYRLLRPAHWPLRHADAMESDLMRSLAQTLAPPMGVAYQEIQLILEPAQRVSGMRWYGRARLTAWRLKQQNLLSTSEEARAIQAKLADTHAWATLRVVTVVRSAADVTAGQEAMRIIESALHSLDVMYQAPGGVTVEQQLTPTQGVAGGVMAARAIKPLAPLPFWLVRVLLAGIVILVAQMLALISTWSMGLWQIWPDLPIWARIGFFGTAIGITMLAGLSAAKAGEESRPWRVLRRIGASVPQMEPLLMPLFIPKAPMMLGARELGKLWHVPDDQTVTEVATQPNRLLPAPASAFVPEGATDWVVLGTAHDTTGILRPVGMPLRALHQMMHVTAGMGAGKSQAAAAMCKQLIPHGFIILDGKGDDEGGGLAAVVRRYLPMDVDHRVFYLDVMDTAFSISLNPIYSMMQAMEAATSKADKDRYFNEALGMLLGLFQRLDPARWRESPGMQQYALMGCHLVLRTGSAKPGEVPTLAKVKRLLDDLSYRALLLERYPTKFDDIYRFWTQREPEMPEGQKSSLAALLRRLDLFLTNPITRSMLAVERPSIDLRQAMDEGQIVLIPMPHRQLGDLAPLVGMLITQSIVAAAYARKGDAQTRVTAPVVIDEVQTFIVDDQSPDLDQAFTQLRGFAVPLIILHQTLNQLGELAETMKINASNRLILRTGEPDASTYATMYKQAGLRPEDILGMEALEHQYAITLGPKREQLVFSLIPNPWPVVEPEILPRYTGPAWQTCIPPADPSWDGVTTENIAAIDRYLAETLYREMSYEAFVLHVSQFAKLPPLMWEALLMRWEAVRAYHRTYILDHPECIPDSIERQMWLTRLVASRSTVIEEALTLRQEIGLGGVTAIMRARDEQTTKIPGMSADDPAPAHAPLFEHRPNLAALIEMRGSGDTKPGVDELFDAHRKEV